MSTKISGYATTERVAPVKGSNGAGAVADKPQAESSSAATAAAQGADHVTLTNSARALQKIEAKIANAPVVNAAKVDSIKQAVEAGTYQVNAGQTADKILQFERALQ